MRVDAFTEFDDLPDEVKQAVWESAKTACPDCGIRGVPQSWAVATANAMTDGQERADES